MRPKNADAYTPGQNNLLHRQLSYLRLFQCAPGVSHSKIQPNLDRCGALIRYRLELQSRSFMSKIQFLNHTSVKKRGPKQARFLHQPTGRLNHGTIGERVRVSVFCNVIIYIYSVYRYIVCIYTSLIIIVYIYIYDRIYIHTSFKMQKSQRNYPVYSPKTWLSIRKFPFSTSLHLVVSCHSRNLPSQRTWRSGKLLSTLNAWDSVERSPSV